MAGFENDVVVAKNLNFNEAGAKPHLGIINAAGKFPIGTGLTQPSQEILGGTITSPLGSLSIGYSSPNITLDVTAGAPYISLSPYIVGPDVHSGYSTIGAAITAAVGAGASASNPANIYIKPQSGGYTENPVLKDGINLIGFNRQTVINGKVSMSIAGTATVNNLTLQDNGDYSLQVGNGSSVVYINQCNFNVVAHTPINISAGLITANNCSASGGTSGAAIYVLTGGNLGFQYCNLSGSSSTPSTSSGGGISFYNSNIAGAHTTSNAFAAINSSMTNGTITINNTGDSSFILNCYLNTTTDPILTMGAGANCYISHTVLNGNAANVITGAGSITYAFLSFITLSGISVSTTTPLATLI